MLERIGAIVRLTRERAEIPLATLADRSGVPLHLLVALERGTPGITTTQLDDVAVALALEPVALLNGREVSHSSASVFLRHAPMQDFDARDETALDEALEQGRSLAGLRSLLRDPPLGLQAGAFQQREAAADRAEAPAQDGYRLAREVRQWLGNPTAPLGDMRALLEEWFGVVVVVRPLVSNRITAVAVRAASAAAVVLSANDPLRAKNPLLARVHLAHELCHALFDPSPGGVHIVLDVVADRKNNAAEQRAKAFAAELLLPREGLLLTVGEASKAKPTESSAALDLITRVRGRFGTPHEITVNHLHNSGYIDQQLRIRLVTEMTAFAGAVPETTLPEAHAASRSVAQLVERAHRAALLTDGDARATLGLDRLAPLPWEKGEL